MAIITLDVPDRLLQSIEELGDQLPIVLEMGISRFAPLSTQAYREALTLLTQDASPEAIVAFRFSSDVEKRINYLLQKNREEQLTKAEEVELERLSQLEEQLQLVKANALIKIARES